MDARALFTLWVSGATACGPSGVSPSPPSPVGVNRAMAKEAPYPRPFPPISGGREHCLCEMEMLPFPPDSGGRGRGIGGLRGRVTPMRGEGSCAVDSECGYDPVHDACGTEAEFNRQPPLVDQGIVCYCEERRCHVLRVPPVPCEGDAGCAVKMMPRPHPVAASAAVPHEEGKVCRDYTISTTCERTNICTMHRHKCRGL
jgi:hypothetical protein